MNGKSPEGGFETRPYDGDVPRGRGGPLCPPVFPTRGQTRGSAPTPPAVGAGFKPALLIALVAALLAGTAGAEEARRVADLASGPGVRSSGTGAYVALGEGAGHRFVFAADDGRQDEGKRHEGAQAEELSVLGDAILQQRLDVGVETRLIVGEAREASLLAGLREPRQVDRRDQRVSQAPREHRGDRGDDAGR